MTDVDKRVAAAQLADELERIVRRNAQQLRTVGRPDLAGEIEQLASKARAIADQQADEDESAL